MELLDQIVDSATGNTEPLPNLLRKCLVSASALKNDTLKTWAQSELNGYSSIEALPSYRRITTIARGHFVGPLGMQLNDQPLSPHVLEEKHRDYATTAYLTQPIAAYDGRPPGKAAQMAWPPALTTKYQTSFYDDLVLNRAWTEIPTSVFAALTDTVRTRILSLALELREQLGGVTEKPESLPPEKVNNSVVYHIYGGNNVIAAAARNINQAGRDIVIAGDISSLRKALADYGVEKEEADAIVGALTVDGTPEHPSLGQKTLGAIKTSASKVAKIGKDVTVAAATSVITNMVLQYLGSGPPLPI